MATPSSDGRLEALDCDEAQRLVVEALAVAGATEATASCVARHVVAAELAGHPSHGLRLVPGYCERAGSDGHRLDVEPRVVDARGATTMVDAGGGLGYLALETAVDAAASTALSLGVGACAVVQTGHAGRAGAWVERAVERGVVGIVLLGGADPPFVMAARPGSSACLHTNPLAIGVPAEGPPLLLDIASSLVAEGKVAIAASRGVALPAGAIVDRDGRPSTDPAAFYDGGALLPFAGHKGFGLAAIVEALTVGLTGADTGEPAEGALVICLDAGCFRPSAEVAASVEALRSRLHASGTEGAVLAPGEPEAASRGRSSVMVETAVLEALRHLAAPAR